MKTLKIDLEEIATKPSYRLLAKATHTEPDGLATHDSYLEVRQYPAHKRTIEIEGRKYFLPFPSMVFVWTAAKYRYGNAAANRLFSNFFTTFAANKKIVVDTDLIYQAPLPNVFEHGRVCMPSPRVHTLDNYVEVFWQSAFRGYNYSSFIPQECLSRDFGSLANWQRMTMAQAESKLSYGAESLKSVIKNSWVYAYDWFGKE
jgi:hypothetical protein